MEHPLPQHQAYTTHSGPWPPYDDYAGDSYSYIAAHHVDGEQACYQVCTASLAYHWSALDPHAAPLSTSNMRISISELM